LGARTFSIITVSKGRLDHLKQTLPRMLALGAAEVIVVDYSCPEGTGDYVQEHFPEARVVRVEDETYFSNWKARNAGAAAAAGDMLVFCDADTLLADNALERIDEQTPDRSFGFFKRAATQGFNKKGLRLALNQLRGFHVIPTATFRAAQGYDKLFEGYAAGADTDLEDRLIFIGLAPARLDPAIVEEVIQHGNEERLEHHREPISLSYGTGLIYRTAKFALLKIRRLPEIPLETRRTLYQSARTAAKRLQEEDSVALTVSANKHAIGMPLQLGFESATLQLSIRVEVAGKKRVDKAPD
jgi:glycosyltransferase involved in cell wall biosynthesis